MLRTIGDVTAGNMLGVAAFVALPSVVLMMMFGQTAALGDGARRALRLEARLRRIRVQRHPDVVTLLTVAW